MKKIVALLIFLLFSINTYAKTITIYAASSLSFAFNRLIKAYKEKYPQDNIKVIFGSSGKGYNQIINGAPYDIFFSADMFYVKKIQEKGLSLTKPKAYAKGRVVIWTRKDSGIYVSKGIKVVLDKDVKKIAIANWKLAPYGKAAKECLQYYGLFDKVKNKLVKGQSIVQTAQFVQIGAADIGFIALSLAVSDKLKNIGSYYLLPEKCHSPILQGYVVLKSASENKERLETALKFYKFIQSGTAKNILKKYGFLPAEENIK